MSLFDFDSRNARLALAGGALLAAAGVLGGGCGGGISTEADFCQQLAQVQCSAAVVMACYGASDASIDADTTTCISTRSRSSHCNPQGLPFHPDAASDCIAAQNDLYADGALTLELVQAAHVACLPVFTKGGVEGTSCGVDTDCDVANGLLCVVHEGGKGSCRVPIPIENGGVCNDAAAQCSDADFCSKSGNCVALPGLKQSCGAGKPCGAGLTCDAATNLCKNQSLTGQSCSPSGLSSTLPAADTQCQGGFCVGAVGNDTGVCADTYQLGIATALCADFRAPTSSGM